MSVDEGSAVEDVAESVDFLQRFVHDVAGSLEEVVGREEAKGYMSVVGDQLGSRFAATLAADDHGRQPHAEPWSADRLGAVLVDIERRIGGGFRSEVDGQGDLVLVNDRCPFGPDVVGRPSLCMVTSGVFGRIAAERFGHVSVEIAESIARGDGRCVVRVAAHPDLELGDTTRHYFADS